MKNRIVYYGDSFISDKARNEKLQFPLSESWPAMLAEKLNLESKNFGRDGVGFDHIVTQFTYNAIEGDISSDDIIVIGTSSWDRKWMVREHPGASHLINLSYDSFRNAIRNDCHPKDRPAVHNQMKIAAEYYVHSWNKSLVYVEQISLLNHVRALSDQLNLTVLILPTFEYYVRNPTFHKFVNYNVNYEVTGWLNLSSLNEFTGSNFDEKYENRHKFFHERWATGFDIRPNHLSIENHHILTNKLYDTITNKVPLNLEEGFVEDIYK